MKPNVSLNMFGTHAFPCQYIFIPQVGQGYFNIQINFQAKTCCIQNGWSSTLNVGGKK
jgi:hypothetical protein